MSITSLTHLILEYRYWILIPLTFAEGPVVAFAAGTLAAAGYFNVYFLAVLFFVRDVVMDGVYYAIGYFAGRSSFVRRMIQKIGVTDQHLEHVRSLWEKYPFRTMFLGKISYGIASAFIVAAGTVEMRLKTFFTYGIIVTILQYGGLLTLGYFFGNALGGSIGGFITNVQYLIAGAAFIIFGYYLFSWYLKSKFIEEEKEMEKEFPS